jgi:two-component system chemotaxis sensor kinase CheA
MINNPAASETVEIEDLVVALTGLATSHLPAAEKQDLSTAVTLPAAPGRSRLVSLSEFDFKHVAKRGKNIFILEFDLLHDVHRTGKTPWSVFKELMACGTILDCAWDLDTVGDLDDEPTNAIPFEVLYATVMDNLMIAELVTFPWNGRCPCQCPRPRRPGPRRRPLRPGPQRLRSLSLPPPPRPRRPRRPPRPPRPPRGRTACG